jgi:hypothetical protein
MTKGTNQHRQRIEGHAFEYIAEELEPLWRRFEDKVTRLECILQTKTVINSESTTN